MVPLKEESSTLARPLPIVPTKPFAYFAALRRMPWESGLRKASTRLSTVPEVVCAFRSKESVLAKRTSTRPRRDRSSLNKCQCG